MVQLRVIAMPALRHVDGPAQPFDIGATRTADSELNAKLILAAERAAMCDTAFDMPIPVFEQPGADVSVIEIEPNEGLCTANIIAPARFRSQFAHLFSTNGRNGKNA